MPADKLTDEEKYLLLRMIDGFPWQGKTADLVPVFKKLESIKKKLQPKAKPKSQPKTKPKAATK
ncbi:hypothetical protein KAR91_49110, partial [Candidatus Pacearchaeota archaeon]|nr:hypothetical protein [Candidatus Pacearchaeota archaeon]